MPEDKMKMLKSVSSKERMAAKDGWRQL